MQYTIRNVPKRLDLTLREQAKREGKSLNECAIEALAAGLNLSDEPIAHHDLDWLAGTWVEDEAFDEVLRDQRRIDEDMWR